LVLAEMSYQYS